MSRMPMIIMVTKIDQIKSKQKEHCFIMSTGICYQLLILQREWAIDKPLMGKLEECCSCVTVLITTLSPQHEAPTFMYTEFDYNLLEYLCIKFQAAGTLIRTLRAYYLPSGRRKVLN